MIYFLIFVEDPSKVSILNCTDGNMDCVTGVMMCGAEIMMLRLEHMCLFERYRRSVEYMSRHYVRLAGACGLEVRICWGCIFLC